MNRHTIIGNITREPDFKSVGAGTYLMRFSVAVNSSYKDKKTGEWVKKTEYVNCQVWGDQAERLSKTLSKGTKVFVEGPSETREYENSLGNKVRNTAINASLVQVIEREHKQQPSENINDFADPVNSFTELTELPF